MDGAAALFAGRRIVAAALDAEAEAPVGVGLGPADGRAGGAWRLIAAPGCADDDDDEDDDVAPLPLLLVGAPVPVAEPPRGFLRYGLTIAMTSSKGRSEPSD